MAMLALKCGDKVIVNVYDLNQKRIDEWNSSTLPIYEPGLDEIISQTRGKNLFFTTDFKSAVVESDIIFLCVNTPTKNYGVGYGKAADLRYLETCAREISFKVTKGPKIIVEKSTVPTRTSQILQQILSKNPHNVKYDIVSNPEFLAEGTAVRDMANPDRVLIGGESPEAVNKLVELYLNWVPTQAIITTNMWSSELSKLVANCFLAQRISSINAISALCEASGAEVKEVSKAIGTDKRIGQGFLQASCGFGGSCFQKDILNLVYLAEHYGLKPVADYFYQIVALNDWQKSRFAKKIVHTMFNTISFKKIAIFGFAFKKQTSDTRESAAIYICKHLLDEKAVLHIYDPKVTAEQIIGDLKAIMSGSYSLQSDFSKVPITEASVDAVIAKHVVIEKDPFTAAKDAHAIVVCTEWDEFKEYDYKKIYEGMCKPAFVFDGRKLFNIEDMKSIGFEIYQIGSPHAAVDW